MSKQFSLLATESDLQIMEVRLRGTKDVELLSDVLSPDLRHLQPLEKLSIPISQAGTVSLFCFLAPFGYGSSLVAKRISPVKTTINLESSHLIQFWRPFYDGKVIRTGRLYYQDKLLIGGEFRNKDPKFLAWADRTLAVVRGMLKRDASLDAFVGFDAAEAIAKGSLCVK